jgi:hypothetical protein
MRVSSVVSTARLLARHPQLGWTQSVLSSMRCCWAQGGSARSVWNERVETGTAARAESFYDSTVERVGRPPLPRDGATPAAAWLLCPRHTSADPPSSAPRPPPTPAVRLHAIRAPQPAAGARPPAGPRPPAPAASSERGPDGFLRAAPQMMQFGRDAWADPDKVVRSANYVQHEVRGAPGLALQLSRFGWPGLALGWAPAAAGGGPPAAHRRPTSPRVPPPINAPAAAQAPGAPPAGPAAAALHSGHQPAHQARLHRLLQRVRDAAQVGGAGQGGAGRGGAVLWVPAAAWAGLGPGGCAGGWGPGGSSRQRLCPAARLWPACLRAEAPRPCAPAPLAGGRRSGRWTTTRRSARCCGGWWTSTVGGPGRSLHVPPCPRCALRLASYEHPPAPPP